MFERDLVILLLAGAGGGQTGAVSRSLPDTVNMAAGWVAVSAGSVPLGAGLALVCAVAASVGAAGAGHLSAVEDAGATVPA